MTKDKILETFGVDLDRVVNKARGLWNGMCDENYSSAEVMILVATLQAMLLNCTKLGEDPEKYWKNMREAVATCPFKTDPPHEVFEKGH